MHRRIAQLPLHRGQAPPWLFRRMVRLAGLIAQAVVDEYGPGEMLRRLADPWWFQAFGCVLGFDWHSSGLTTVTCGALKEAARERGADLGFFVAGGKGATSRRTPEEIERAADRHAITDGERLVAASRLSAKVDSAAVQDGFQLYHHCFLSAPDGTWAVVQQGMNERTGWARRYHWLSETAASGESDPHHGIEDAAFERRCETPAFTELLNAVASEGEANRRATLEMLRERPDRLLAEVERATRGPTLFAPRRHRVLSADVNVRRLRDMLVLGHETQPEAFSQLLLMPRLGPVALRSLVLVAELIYDAPVSRRDPATPAPTAGESAAAAGKAVDTAATTTEPDATRGRRWADYSHAHGGKDGTPFPVDRRVYDHSIAVLERALQRARLGDHDRVEALKRLAAWERRAGRCDR